MLSVLMAAMTMTTMKATTLSGRQPGKQTNKHEGRSKILIASY